MSEGNQSEPRLINEEIDLSRSFEIIPTDRMRLMDAANMFVTTMTWKQVTPLVASSVPGQSIELTSGEQRAYDSALDYLARQFEVGFREVEKYEKSNQYKAHKKFSEGNES
jgi:hypothetical protein